jgi:hypothetical protein
MVVNGLPILGLALPTVADGAGMVECRNGLEEEGLEDDPTRRGTVLVIVTGRYLELGLGGLE